MCKFRKTPACVKTCGNFTIPGNATGRRNSGTSLPNNTLVTRLLGYETLVVTCDSNYRLNLAAGSCHYEATLRCDADTGVLSTEVGGTAQPAINPNSVACVARCKCGDGRKDAFCNEECDDGNSAGSDGCSSTCSVEAGWTCTQNHCQQSVCSQIPPASCPISMVDARNGVIQPGEGSVPVEQTVDVKCNEGYCCHPADDSRCLQFISGTEDLPLREGTLSVGAKSLK